MEIKERKINELIPAEYNPRQLSKEQAEQLKASLERFGAVDPAIINIHPERKNIIVGGHQRLKTAQSIGWDTFPCVEVELDRDKERELNIRLNKNTGAWDYDALANFFEVEELTEWGFTDSELFGSVDEQIDQIEDGEEIELPQSVQLEPPMEYILIMAEPNSVDWEDLKETLKLKMVRRGGYKKGSAFDSVAIERVITWNELKNRLDADSDTE